MTTSTSRSRTTDPTSAPLDDAENAAMRATFADPGRSADITDENREVVARLADRGLVTDNGTHYSLTPEGGNAVGVSVSRARSRGDRKRGGTRQVQGGTATWTTIKGAGLKVGDRVVFYGTDDTRGREGTVRKARYGLDVVTDDGAILHDGRGAATKHWIRKLDGNDEAGGGGGRD